MSKRHGKKEAKGPFVWESKGSMLFSQMAMKSLFAQNSISKSVCYHRIDSKVIFNSPSHRSLGVNVQAFV